MYEYVEKGEYCGYGVTIERYDGCTISRRKVYCTNELLLERRNFLHYTTCNDFFLNYTVLVVRSLFIRLRSQQYTEFVS